ncbi:MAG: YceI family protein [Planctomycetota bacterium]|nr:YceI family protein [Planctomycetota bacterium]
MQQNLGGTRFTKLAAAFTLVAALGGAAAIMGAAGRAPQPAAAAASADGAFKVDAVHSSVAFRIQRVNGAPFYGTFRQLSGEFNFEGANPSASFTIPVESIDSNNEGRDKHLKSPDFFSSKEFPNLTFKSTSIKKTGENTFELAGELTVRGTTKPITAKATQTGTGPARGGGTMIGYDVQFTIKRAEFGITYGPQALGDEVTVMVGLEGKR